MKRNDAPAWPIRKKTIKLVLVMLPIVFAFNVLEAQQKFPEPVGDDDTGFQSIFDGESLKGWEGDPTYWRVKDGSIIGEVTPETILKRNSFLIWRGGQPGDFELKLEYRVSKDGNSGVNYRSVQVEDTPYALKGYQCDIDGKGRWTGQNYEERARKFLALRGQFTQIMNAEEPKAYATVGDKEELLNFINEEDWNECHIIVRGNTMVHVINGQVMSVVIDNDTENRKNKGLLGVQVHVGPPMTIAYRNIRLKEFNQ
ncbi:3-keto-disaccharide hydrolase [Croceivirga lutea]|uniref:3-keto-disaccharide hydrolase n=1 Tax=Croceivirga lutea TaxID=1775167 RepID=UPI001E5CF982|nr:DUF1080 domain-containing protein [Croceivirga lutea]